MAAQHPDRTEGLVLSGATIRYTGWDGLSTRLYGIVFPLFAKPAMKSFAAKMSEDLGQELADQIMVGGLSARGGAQSLRRVPGADYAARMAGFQGPIVLANGARDTSNRDGEADFISQFPHAESMVIQDAGHACALQQPEAFAAVVRHLVGVVTSPA
jgi:pimeloyl-ACP methyl ester carboxylesterase